MKKALFAILPVTVLIASHALKSSAQENLESVHHFTPEQTDLLLKDSSAEAALIAERRAALAKGAAKHADRLLGEYSVIPSVDSLNDLPATAAGLEPIIVISPQRAEELLGDNPSPFLPDPK